MRVLLRQALILLILCAGLSAQTTATHAREYTYRVVHAYPHDPQAFTQGLVYHDGFLYEGTGLKGHSSLRKVKLETGEVLQKTDLPADLFGEGVAIFGSQIFQLTWQSHEGFVYKISDFQFVHEFSYPGEGWGLTSNNREIFMSDGTAEIRVLDPQNLKEKRRFTVRDGDKPIDQINELEWVGGEIYANVWQTDRIARISPSDGHIVGWIDLAGLLSPVYHLEPGAVLNGIAYDAVHKRIFVTGKLWPKLFEIAVVPKAR